ncbi:MAG: M48 family metallopeptidase [Pseudomonadota bacterium]
MVAVSATFLDGESAQPYEVLVDLREAGLHISASGVAAEWPYDEIRALPQEADPRTVVLYPEGRPLVRLTVHDADFAKALKARARHLKRRPRQSAAIKRTLGLAAAAVGSVALIIFVILPALADRLAVLIPPDSEVAFGELVREQVDTVLSSGSDEEVRVCAADAGQAALASMVETLSKDLDLPYPLVVEVITLPQINAFALPGGQIVLFSGLIEEADTPEEVAGVLAHEIAHVINRDPARSALRRAGSAGLLGLLVGDVTGGFLVAGLADALVNASYSRETEAAADAFVHERFRDLNLPTTAFADFFVRVAPPDDVEVPEFLTLLNSHPDARLRAALAREADTVGDASYTPVLNAEAWADLQAICG